MNGSADCADAGADCAADASGVDGRNNDNDNDNDYGCCDSDDDVDSRITVIRDTKT